MSPILELAALDHRGEPAVPASRLLYLEIRRSPLRWVVPLLVVVELGLMFGQSTDWIGIWPEASVAVQDPAWFIAPVLAAAAAWAAGGEHQASAARRAWQREAIQLTATLVYSLVPLLIGASVAVAVSQDSAGPGFLWPSYLLLGASLLCTSAAVGHLVGRLSHSRHAATVVAAMIFLGLTWFSVIPDLAFTALSGPPQLQVSTPALIARLSLTTAVAVAAISVGSLSGSSSARARFSARTRAIAVTAAAVLMTVSVGGVLASGPLQAERPPPEQPVCTSDRIRLCVWPEHRKYLPAMSAMANRLEHLADAGLVTVPATFNEERLPGEADQLSFVLALGEWVAARGVVAQVEKATFAGSPCQSMDDAEHARFLAAELALHEWLVARTFGGVRPADTHGGFRFDAAELARVLALPDAEQFTWAQSRIAAVREGFCTT